MSPVEATPAIRKTALNAVHRKLGAKMVEFNRWDMPVEYSGIIAEHMAVRTGVGIFDVSHMGDIRVAGREALAAIQHISINDASRLAIGQAQYSAMLYKQGTFVDDIIVHRLDEEEYLIVINAGTREKDFNWVRENTHLLAQEHPDRSHGLHGRRRFRNLRSQRRSDQHARLERGSRSR